MDRRVVINAIAKSRILAPLRIERRLSSPHYRNLLPRFRMLCVTYKTGSWIGLLDLLTPYTQHLELQAITALSVIYTFCS
jgi:hypothetical protein